MGGSGKGSGKAKAKAAASQSQSLVVGGVPPPASLHKNTTSVILEAQEQLKRILDHDAFQGVELEVPPLVGSNKFSAQD